MRTQQSPTLSDTPCVRRCIGERGTLRQITLPISVVVLAAVPVLALAQTPQHGIRELTESGSFEIPRGVYQIVVEVWGAGGGGGGGAGAAVGAGPGGGGGGGGSGAYVRAAVTVTQGEMYVVSLGTAGRGGRGEGKRVTSPEPGTKGGDSSLRIGTRTIVTAPGGQGGHTPRPFSSRGASGGMGGSLTSPDPSSLFRPGNSGGDGQNGGNPDMGLTPGGVAGRSVVGTIVPLGSFGGAGGKGGFFGEGGDDGLDGGRGVAIISW